MNHRGFAPHPDRPLTQAEYELDVIIGDIEFFMFLQINLPR